MHFITGGAYNGKSAWVRDFYHLDNETKSSHWISAYQDDELPKDFSIHGENRIILEGMEQWILKLIERDAYSREIGNKLIQNWIDWEESHADRKIVVIGVDISKGIVPIEKKNRLWRDLTGWFYQDLVKHCERVDLIWYGIPKKLK